MHRITAVPRKTYAPRKGLHFEKRKVLIAVYDIAETELELEEMKDRAGRGNITGK